ITLGLPLPIQRRNRSTSPGAIDVEAQEMVEKIVARRDGREHPADEVALRRAVGRHHESMLGRHVVCRHRPKFTRAAHAIKRAGSLALEAASSRSYFHHA